MGSFHDSMASHFGAPMLFSHFGEPVEQQAVVSYLRPGENQAKRLDNAIIHDRNAVDSLETNEGVLVRMERRSIELQTAQLAAIGVSGVEERAVVTLPDGDWAIDADASIWGVTFVKLGLKREIGTGFGERRYGDA